jgi:hypothetical protein
MLFPGKRDGSLSFRKLERRCPARTHVAAPLRLQPINSREFTQPAHNFVLRQNCELVDADRRGRIQSRIAPFLNNHIEIREPKSGGFGCGNEIIVPRVEQDNSRAHLAAGALVEVDPYQDHLTRSEVHGMFS